MIEACPDIPINQRSAKIDISSLSLTEIILPDITMEAFLGQAQGKLLILFISRALVNLERAWLDDLQRLRKLKTEGRLPDLTQGSCSHLNVPHVDPQDEDENVCELDPASSPEGKEKVLAWIETGRLVQIDVWLCLKLRRNAISSFILSLAEQHQKQVEDKPSPSVTALIRGEIEQRLAFSNSQHQPTTAVESVTTTATTPAPTPAHVFTAVPEK